MQLHSFLTATEYEDDCSASRPGRFNSAESAIGKVDERKGGGKLVRITGARRARRGPEPHYVAHVFLSLDSSIICRLYQLTLSDQTPVTLQMTVSLADLV